MNKTDIAVLLTCHNRREKTLASLRCLYSQDCLNEVNFSVYLVDDGSSDGTGEAVKSEFPQVTVIQGDGSLFWNRGMLKAWVTAAETTHDFFLWLNDDTDLESSAISMLLEDYKNAGVEDCIISGAVRSSVTGEITYGGRVTRGWLLEPNGTLQSCQEFNGNAVLIPFHVYEKIGMLDPYFRHSFGDIEYGMRANKENINCFSSCRYVGFCETHSEIPKWQNRRYSVAERFKHLYSPLGMNPCELFHINKRYNGLFTACSVFILNHLRCFFTTQKQ